METEKRKALEKRRQQLQLRQAAAAFIESDLQPYLEILDELKKHGISYKIVELAHVEAAWIPYVEATVQQSPYMDYGFHKEHVQSQGVVCLLNKLYDRYPSINSFRYVPDLPKYADYAALPSDQTIRDGLQKVATSLGLRDQKVYLQYLRYAPIIEISLFALKDYDHKDLFNTWHGDVLIFPPELDWLIAFSLEEEWYGGARG